MTTKGGKNNPTRKATRQQQSANEELTTKGDGDDEGRGKKEKIEPRC